MAKIGILITIDKLKERMDFSYFDHESFFGFKRIIKDIDLKKHSIDYISPIDINNYDFVLCTCTSRFDYLNLAIALKNKKGKVKVIIGGAGFLNIWPLYDFIDIAVFGRGETLINKILEGENLKNVWYKDKDKFIENKYEIGQPLDFINEKNGKREYSELAIGCKRKCFFCQYGWKFKYCEKDNIEGYSSGSNQREDFFQNIDWNYTGRYFVSGLDGLTEKTRKIIGKSVSNNEIIETLKKRDESEKEKVFIKLYNIIYFPFDEKIEYSEFFECIEKSGIKKNTTLLINNTHFMPMPLTPMENERVVIKKDDIKIPMEIKGVKLFKSFAQTGYMTSVEQVLIDRIDFSNKELFLKIICSKKYNNLKSYEKLQIVDKFFPGIYQQFENVIPYLIRANNIEIAKKTYYKNAYAN